MTITKVLVPSIRYAYFYPELVAEIQRQRAIMAPELSDFSDFELTTVIEKMFALVGHLNNVNVDLLANESFMRTAVLAQSVRDHLRKIGYRLAPASPSEVDIVYVLGKPITTSTVVVPELAACGTNDDEPTSRVSFERTDANLVVQQSEVFDFAYTYELIGGVETWVDVTAKAAVDNDPFVAWQSVELGHAVYFGMLDVMWDGVQCGITTPGTLYRGVWEVGNTNLYKVQPDSVTYDGIKLTIDLTSYLGDINVSGVIVRVRHNSTGLYEEAVVYWTGSKNKVDVGILGQVNPSEDPSDYTAGAYWEAVRQFTSAVTQLGVQPDLTYVLPQTAVSNWQPIEVNGTTAWWLRYRVTEKQALATSPTLNFCDPTFASQYVIGRVRQGSTTTESLGSTTGQPNQSFSASQKNYLDASMELTINGDDSWTEVENFLSSGNTDLHFVVELKDDDMPTIVLGDGINGFLPQPGSQNVSVAYRTGGDLDGNVGAGTITRDRTGLTRVSSLRNPRQARGWAQSQGSTPLGLELSKLQGTAQLRHRGVAINKTDVPPMVRAYSKNGIRPFSRAVAYEGTFGEKTIEVVLMASGGAVPSQDQLDDIELYFNGDDNAAPPVPKRIIANQQLVATVIQLRVVNVHMIVKGGVSVDQVKSQLRQFINPEAHELKRTQDELGEVTYVVTPKWMWEFGGRITTSSLHHIIHAIDPSVKEVTTIEPASNIQLGKRELPIVGSIKIEVIK